MLSPAANHLSQAHNQAAKIIRAHDRGTIDPRREQAREDWRTHGAQLVSDIPSLIGDGEFDGLIICAGKNGDDAPMIEAALDALQTCPARERTILHLSTISAKFAQESFERCQAAGLNYVNYPLTGGPNGARAASMLILASGDPAIYQSFLPMLEQLGTPRYFGPGVAQAAEIKLIGHFMVYGSLIGISSAAALRAACFDGQIGGKQATDFFEFLNNGAGGSRQWPIALKKGITSDVWNQGFMLKHATIDALYAAQLALSKGLSLYVLWPMLQTACAFSYLLNTEGGDQLATHAIARFLSADTCKDLDAFLLKHMDFSDPENCLKNIESSLPEAIQRTACL